MSHFCPHCYLKHDGAGDCVKCGGRLLRMKPRNAVSLKPKKKAKVKRRRPLRIRAAVPKEELHKALEILAQQLIS